MTNVIVPRTSKTGEILRAITAELGPAPTIIACALREPGKQPAARRQQVSMIDAWLAD